MTICGGCHRCGRLMGFAAKYLARHGELATGGRTAEPKLRWVWVDSVRDRKIFSQLWMVSVLLRRIIPN